MAETSPVPPPEDYLGRQIAWSVRDVMPPGRELMDAITRLPRPLAVLAIRVLQPIDVLPKMEDPIRYCEMVIDRFGREYLDAFGKTRNADTVTFEGIQAPIVSHASTYREDDKKKRLHWESLVRWAIPTAQRYDELGAGLTEENKEAIFIAMVNQEIQRVLSGAYLMIQERGIRLSPQVLTKFPHEDK